MWGRWPQPAVDRHAPDSTRKATGARGERRTVAICFRPSQGRSTFPAGYNPLERVNREIARRSDIVGIYPNDAALLRLATSFLVEQKSELQRARVETQERETVREHVVRLLNPLQLLGLEPPSPFVQ